MFLLPQAAESMVQIKGGTCSYSYAHISLVSYAVQLVHSDLTFII